MSGGGGGGAFDPLPDEALYGALYHLDFGSLMRMCSVDRRMAAICSGENAYFWRNYNRLHGVTTGDTRAHAAAYFRRWGYRTGVLLARAEQRLRDEIRAGAFLVRVRFYAEPYRGYAPAYDVIYDAADLFFEDLPTLTFHPVDAPDSDSLTVVADGEGTIADVMAAHQAALRRVGFNFTSGTQMSRVVVTPLAPRLPLAVTETAGANKRARRD